MSAQKKETQLVTTNTKGQELHLYKVQVEGCVFAVAPNEGVAITYSLVEILKELNWDRGENIALVAELVDPNTVATKDKKRRVVGQSFQDQRVYISVGTAVKRLQARQQKKEGV